MNRFKVSAAAVAALALSGFLASDARAVAFRTFVSSTGADGNTVTNCGRATPCQHYASAYSVTSAGGEVVALDSAGFGGLTITTAVTITAIPGEFGYINVPLGTNGITINAGVNDVVVLRNLQISGANAVTTTGVQLNSGNLSIENCRFSQLLTSGATLAGGASSITNITNSDFVANARGLIANSGAVNVHNSTFASNATSAIRADGQGPDQDPATGGTTPRLTVVRVGGGLISSNGTAFEMNNPGTAGTRPPGQCNAQNIFLRGDSNILGNPTFLTVTGSADLNAGCMGSVTIGGYAVQTQNQSTVANQ